MRKDPGPAFGTRRHEVVEAAPQEVEPADDGVAEEPLEPVGMDDPFQQLL